jgi:hypothetical protein
MIFEEQSTIEHMVFRILTHTLSLMQCSRVQVLRSYGFKVVYVEGKVGVNVLNVGSVLTRFYYSKKLRGALLSRDGFL